MPMLVIPPHAHPIQVDDFPADAARSVEGALHIRPGTKDITADELAHLEKSHAKIMQGIQVLKDAPVPAPEPSEARVSAAREDVAEEVAPEAAPLDEEASPPRRGRR